MFQPSEQVKLQQCLRRMASIVERQQPIFILRIKAAHREGYFHPEKELLALLLAMMQFFLPCRQEGAGKPDLSHSMKHKEICPQYMLKYPSIPCWEKYTFPKKAISPLSDRHEGRKPLLMRPSDHSSFCSRAYRG